MSTGRITWDDAGKRLYETGTDRGVLYPVVGENAATDGKAYTGAVAWNGLTGFTESPEGAEANAIYADNIKYLNLRSAEDYGATITAYTYPEEFEDCNGQKSARTGGGIYLGQQPRKNFGFSCRTLIGNDQQGDDFGYKIHLLYGCSVSPSERSYQTVNDSPEAIEFSWDVDTIPTNLVPEGFKPTACVTIDSTKFDDNGATMQTIENILYGSDAGNGSTATEGYLPTPAKLIEILAGD